MFFVPRPVFVLVCACMLQACTPQAALLASLIPDSTLNVVLGNLGIVTGNLERVSDANRRRVAELEQRGDWKGLAMLAESSLRDDRANADWWLVAGYARSQLREHEAAAKAYEEVLRLEPDNPAAWHLLAQSYRVAGDSKRAVNVLNNALLALRDPPLTHYLLGESYADLKRDDEAAAAYRAAVKLEERFPAAWFGLAKAYGRLGRGAEAREAQARLEKLDPKLAQRLREGT
jgi:tetratricopeptide (TPR) repeat protein